MGAGSMSTAIGTTTEIGAGIGMSTAAGMIAGVTEVAMAMAGAGTTAGGAIGAGVQVGGIGITIGIVTVGIAGTDTEFLGPRLAALCIFRRPSKRLRFPGA